jgi:Tc5 transposase DNA-binding domain
MTSYSELDIQAAIEDLLAARFRSVREVAAAYSIPPTTLTRRLRSGQSRQISHNHQQTLSPDQEERLVQWIMDLEQQGHAPTHHQVWEMALQISIHSGGPSIIGVNWVSRFLRRHPALSTKIARRLDALRAKSINLEDLQAWYAYFQEQVTKYNIQSADIWNMDETGTAIGSCNNGKVIGNASIKRTYKKVITKGGEWVIVTVAKTAKHSWRANATQHVCENPARRSLWVLHHSFAWTLGALLSAAIIVNAARLWDASYSHARLSRRSIPAPS